MKVPYRRFDQSLPQPKYQSQKAAAFDLYARVETLIEPQSIAYIPLNFAVKLPPNHWGLVAARSSLHKRGLMLINGVGIGDEDFSGNQDEYKAAVFNFTAQPVTVAKGERIAQMLILPREVVELVEVEQLDEQNRGGFGTTGQT